MAMSLEMMHISRDEFNYHYVCMAKIGQIELQMKAVKMVIDHIGIAVKSIESALEYWRDIFGYHQATEIVVNTRQKVKVAFMEKSGSLTVKLISPSDKTSPLHKFLARGEGIHHLCFKCDNLDAQLEEFKAKGMRLITPAQPGEAFDNENIAFVFGKMGLNIEVIDTDKRAKRIACTPDAR